MWSHESSYIRFHVTSTFIQAVPFFPRHFARHFARAAAARGDADLTVLVFYGEN